MQGKQIFIIGFLLLIFGVTTSALAQTDPIIEGSDIRPFTASGSIGIKLNGYNASGIENRRAPASLQTNANLNFSLFGLSSGLNLLYSTDQTGLRQNMNNLSFNASWKWVTVQAGSVSPSFSDYGLSGTTIRGGYITATPGNWLVEVSGGQARRKIEFQTGDGFRDPAYERWTAATKFGYGNKNNSHFYLSTHYSIDKVSDLNNNGTNNIEVTPEENLTLTPDAQIALFEGKFTVSSQVTFSAYTRDLNSAALPIGSAGIPSFVGEIFKPRTSSRLNYAGQAGANLNLDNFGLQVGYERIQPGFRSLGVGRMRDDQEEILIAPSARFLDNRLSLQGSLTLGRDNLLGTRLQTRRNTGVGTNAQYQLTDMIMLSANYNLMVNDFSSSAAADSLQQAGLGQMQVSHTFMLQPNFTVRQGDLMHNFGVSGSYFKMNNEFKGSTNIQNNFSSDTYSGSLNYSLTFPSGFSVNAMGNYLVYNSARTDNQTVGANAGASYAFLENKLSMNLNLGFNQNTNEINRSGQNLGSNTFKTQQLMVNLSSNYRIYEKGSLSLNLRSRTNNALEGAGTKYTELEGTINFQHRF